jgi:2-methylcitrate dehydratase PrpD
MFPSQFGTHFTITAGLDLHPKVSDYGAIHRISLTTPVMSYVNRPFPDNGLAGKFSFQYTFCRALVDGRVTICPPAGYKFDETNRGTIDHTRELER